MNCTATSDKRQCVDGISLSYGTISSSYRFLFFFSSSSK